MNALQSDAVVHVGEANALELEKGRRMTYRVKRTSI